jgi:hypothetical protein
MVCAVENQIDRTAAGEKTQSWIGDRLVSHPARLAKCPKVLVVRISEEAMKRLHHVSGASRQRPADPATNRSTPNSHKYEFRFDNVAASLHHMRRTQ